jgi:hypothetical protein
MSSFLRRSLCAARGRRKPRHAEGGSESTTLDAMANTFSRLFGRLTGARKEDQLVRFILAETHRGRDLREVLDDPYVKNRADPTTLRRLMDHPELVKGVGGDAVQKLRDQLASLR